MLRFICRILCFVLTPAVVWPSFSWGEFYAGLDAYTRGDYVAVLKEWRPVAEQGFREAQFVLGGIYDGGKGVPEDHQKALKWFRKAADQGHP